MRFWVFIILMTFMEFVGFILFRNGKLMILDRLQYFYDDFWNFEHLAKVWTCRPPNSYQYASTNTKTYGVIHERYYI